MTHNPMRSVCLGVDPGIANTGLAIVVRTPSDYKLVALRCVTSRADEPEAQRLRKIYDAVDALLADAESVIFSPEFASFRYRVSRSDHQQAMPSTASL